MINKPNVQFNLNNQPEFFTELRKNVQQYFTDNKISRHANFAMVIKTAVMISLYIVPFILMVTGVVQGTWPVLGMWVIMGLGMAGIGLSVMHDANHGSYSKHNWINKLFGYISNLLGAYHTNWIIQHNVLHHSFTNVEGHDEDIDNAVFRLSPFQDHKPIHRYQAFYAPFFYGLLTLYWFTAKDFLQIIRFKKKDLIKTQRKTLRKALVEITINKIWYIGLTIVLPLVVVGVSWWVTIIGFIIMHFICGLLLSLIFQAAHVLEETDYFNPDEEGNIESSWAILQLRTTANFSKKSKLFSWYIGGLNYQIEHHLFPNICHIHYPSISSIVENTAKKYDLPYYNHATFIGALKSHTRRLKQLSNPDYKLA